MNKNLKLKNMIRIALMAALCFIVTYLFKVPTFYGYAHLGDSIIFLTAILFGSFDAAFASAIGMMLVDVLGGYAIWAPFTFIIKGIMGYIAGKISYRKNYNGNNIINNIFAGVVSGVWMIAAYYVAGAFILYLFGSSSGGHMVKMSLGKGFIAALSDVPSNTAEVIVGLIAGIIISKPLKNALCRYL